MFRTRIPNFKTTHTLLSSGLLIAGLLSGTAVRAVVAAGSFAFTGSMTTARTGHTATLLQNGQVLVAGGGNSTVVASAELYDPATGTWTLTGSMATARTYHTATLLPNGEVLVVGGLSNGNSGINTSCAATAELYNPSTGQWTATGSTIKPRGNHTATLLRDGKVLVAGGLCSGGFDYADAGAEIYNPSTGKWTATGNMNVARVNTAATLLTSGQVLIAGGNTTSSGSRSAELYDPSTGKWTSTGSMSVYRATLAATLLPNGDVLVFGGTGLASSASEFYNPSKGVWTMTGQYGVAPANSGLTLILLASGLAQVAGGRTKYGVTSYSRLYDSSSNSWPFSDASLMNHARQFHTATLLPNGQVLVAGGFDGATQLATAELYSP
jgi:N-acetylneuraminic acid mutarotase